MAILLLLCYTNIATGILLPRRQKKNPVDFDDELKIGDVRYDNMT